MLDEIRHRYYGKLDSEYDPQQKKWDFEWLITQVEELDKERADLAHSLECLQKEYVEKATEAETLREQHHEFVRLSNIRASDQQETIETLRAENERLRDELEGAQLRTPGYRG